MASVPHIIRGFVPFYDTPACFSYLYGNRAFLTKFSSDLMIGSNLMRCIILSMCPREKPENPEVLIDRREMRLGGDDI